MVRIDLSVVSGSGRGSGSVQWSVVSGQWSVNEWGIYHQTLDGASELSIKFLCLFHPNLWLGLEIPVENSL